MQTLINIGKYLFAIPLLIFGVFHFANANIMAGMAPFGGTITIYITGACLVAGAVAIIIGKYDKLASVLMAVLLLLFLIPHVQIMMSAADETAKSAEMVQMLKNICIAGGALAYAALAKDSTHAS